MERTESAVFKSQVVVISNVALKTGITVSTDRYILSRLDLVSCDPFWFAGDVNCKEQPAHQPEHSDHNHIAPWSGRGDTMKCVKSSKLPPPPVPSRE